MYKTRNEGHLNKQDHTSYQVPSNSPCAMVLNVERSFCVPDCLEKVMVKSKILSGVVRGRPGHKVNALVVF